MSASKLKRHFLSLTDKEQEVILKDLNRVRLASDHAGLIFAQREYTRR